MFARVRVYKTLRAIESGTNSSPVSRNVAPHAPWPLLVSEAAESLIGHSSVNGIHDTRLGDNKAAHDVLALAVVVIHGVTRKLKERIGRSSQCTRNLFIIGCESDVKECIHVWCKHVDRAGARHIGEVYLTVVAKVAVANQTVLRWMEDAACILTPKDRPVVETGPTNNSSHRFGGCDALSKFVRCMLVPPLLSGTQGLGQSLVLRPVAVPTGTSSTKGNQTLEWNLLDEVLGKA